jgi:hypothetical protein
MALSVQRFVQQPRVAARGCHPPSPEPGGKFGRLRGDLVADVSGPAGVFAVEHDMNEMLFVVEEAEDGSYRAQAVGASIHTEAETLEEMPELIRDAVHCHFEEGAVPTLIRLHHVPEEPIQTLDV